MPGIGIGISRVLKGSRLNPSPPIPDEVPEGAIQFEDSDTYVKFETGEFVVFEEPQFMPEGALQFEGTEIYATFDNGEFITFENN